MKRSLIFLALVAVIALAAACKSSDKGQPQATSTPRALPTPVSIRQEPENVALGDPAFEALPRAKADFGHLGGTVYRIEVPDNWNGRLLLFMHGFADFAPTAAVDTPVWLRSYLIYHGWAWGASSYSSTGLIPGRAADETAALWDYFAGKEGRPARTYVTGVSMGGAATDIAAERYGDRYDGALGLCGFAGQSGISTTIGNLFIAGAYVAGVTQAEFDSGGRNAPQLIQDRIRPALEDPARHKKFVDIMLDLTGGPRSFDHQGFALAEALNWQELSAFLAGLGPPENGDSTYQLGPLSDVSTADFNAGVIRVQPTDNQNLTKFFEGNELTGGLQMPLLTIHTTGDWAVPINQEQVLRRKVDAAGKGDLLVQRIVQDANHCYITNAEWEKGLEDLVAWVEHGKKPNGEDVLGDLTKAGKFTLSPRLGSPGADKVAGAGERVVLSGKSTLDGQPLTGGQIWVEVIDDHGLRTVCNFDAPVGPGSRYEVTVAGDGEVRGCGAPGRQLHLATYTSQVIYSQTLPWPDGKQGVTFDVDFTSASAGKPADSYTFFFPASVVDSSGRPMPPGTVIEAYIGDVRCTVNSVPPVVMAWSWPDLFDLLVVGPEAVPGCDQGGKLSFRVNGKPVPQVAVNDFGFHSLDLTVP